MKLLVTGAYPYSKEQLEMIEELGNEVYFHQMESEPLSINLSTIDGVICNNLFLYHKIEQFANLKYIQVTSAGTDRLPMDYIEEHNIELHTAKDVYSIPIAEWVVLKILEIYKKSNVFYEQQKGKEWKKHRDILELTDKVVAIVGFGGIGQEVAKRIKPFDTKIFTVGRRHKKSDLIDKSYLIEDLEEVLLQSDIVILSIALTDETKHLFNKKMLESMKEQSVLINVSRGGVIDELALIDTLKSKRILGAALDVFEEEPLMNSNELWNLDNVVITPHNSFISDLINTRLRRLVISNLIKYSQGEG